VGEEFTFSKQELVAEHPLQETGKDWGAASSAVTAGRLKRGYVVLTALAA